MTAFLQLLISGISLGCIYALIALGFVLIYKATETVNFAQGELMMLGAFAGLALMQVAQLPFVAAAVLAIAAMAAFGVLLERVAIRPILGQPQFTDRDADDRPGLHGARPDDDGAELRLRHPCAARALQGAGAGTSARWWSASSRWW